MAYIPPHKRHSRDSERPTPTPESLAPLFKKNVKLGARNANPPRSYKTIVFSEHAICRWFGVGLDDGNGDASASYLKEVSVEAIKRRSFILVKNKIAENDEAKGSPSSSIAENVVPDLLSSFENLRAKELKDAKPALVARFGNIIFHTRPPMNLESGTETNLRETKRTFYTTVPASHTANIMAEVASKIGVDFAEAKDVYHVKLSDSTQPGPGSILSCKCRVNDDNKLQLYKVELNPERDMIIDISCLDKGLDLRLSLFHKRILTSIPDEEMQNLRNLIDAAVVDPAVKGGLRWPFGKASSGKYNVVKIWHIVASTYQNASVRLKVKHADRFDFVTSYGEASPEVVFNMKGIVSGLLEHVEADVISEMLKDNLSLIWQRLLRCEPFLNVKESY